MAIAGNIQRRWLLMAAVVLVGIASYVAWRYLSPRESTDDAQVAGHVGPIATRVGGTIARIVVHDNQAVNAGDVLVEIDKRDYEIALSRAEADVAAAEAAARAARTGVPVRSASARSEQSAAEAGTGGAQAAIIAGDREVDAADAKLAAARARRAEADVNVTRTTQDLDRLKPLAAKDEIPKQHLDLATTAAAAARAAVDSAEASVREAQANLEVARARRQQMSSALSQAQAQVQAAATAPQQIALSEAQAAGADAQVLQARAAVEQARLNLERTVVRAPTKGIVSRRAVEQGQVVQAGQPLMALASLDDVWVSANFKETQLTHMHVGQPADVAVDAFGGRTFRAHIDSISAATGATFSLLPADNATGNYVKVVQRVPVKIVLDDASDAAAVLRPGMSVSATVFLR